MLRALVAISLLVGGCVMPQHRGVATFCNGYVLAGGVAIGAMASSAEGNPNSWVDLDRAASNVALGMILLAATGEALTVALHHDEPSLQ